jgi:3-oxoadipate enol-lactonase
MTHLAQSYIHHSARDILPRVRVPTLFVVGEKDSLALPSHAREVARLVPACEARVIQGCTHLAPVERPAEVHAIAEAFLERVGAPRPLCREAEE